MEKNERMKVFLGYVDMLSSEERTLLAEKLVEVMLRRRSEPQIAGCAQPAAGPKKKGLPSCPRCGAEPRVGVIVKKGFKNGAQRYKCTACERYFFLSTNTMFHHAKKDIDFLRKYIDMTMAGKSLPVCKEECGIAFQTAFNWRHKVLDAFEVVRAEESPETAGQDAVC